MNVRWMNENAEWSHISQMKIRINKWPDLKLGNLRIENASLEKGGKCSIKSIFKCADIFFKVTMWAPLDI